MTTKQRPNSPKDPKGSPKDPRGSRMRAILSTTLPEADVTLIERAVAQQGGTISQFLRDAATDRARTILGIPAEPPLQAAS